MSEDDTQSGDSTNLYSSGIFGRIKKIYREKGCSFLVRKITVFSLRFFYSLMLLKLRKKRYFMFENVSYPMFYHSYNFTWDNERAVEVPVIKELINASKGQKILEAGNVLSHYFKPEWDIIDKFEKARGIINEDIETFVPENKYDLIVSISTLEHVGFDDDIKDPEKISRSLDNLINNCLKPFGKMIFTIPMGYNPSLDKQILNGDLCFDKQYFLKRISKNEWLQLDHEELDHFGYGTKYIEAEVVVIAEYNAVKARK